MLLLLLLQLWNQSRSFFPPLLLLSFLLYFSCWNFVMYRLIRSLKLTVPSLYWISHSLHVVFEADSIMFYGTSYMECKPFAVRTVIFSTRLPFYGSKLTKQIENWINSLILISSSFVQIQQHTRKNCTIVFSTEKWK